MAKVFLDSSQDSFSIKILSAFLNPSLIQLVESDSSKAPLFENGQRKETDLTAIFLAVLSLDSKVNEQLLGNRSDEIHTWLNYVKTDLKPAIASGEKKQLLPVLHKLNKKIEPIVYLVSNQFSLADIVLFSSVQPVVASWKDEETWTFDNISRWYDNIQHLKVVQPLAEKKGFVAFKRNVPKEKGAKAEQSEHKKEAKAEQPEQKKEEKPKAQEKSQSQEKSQDKPSQEKGQGKQKGKTPAPKTEAPAPAVSPAVASPASTSPAPSASPSTASEGKGKGKGQPQPQAKKSAGPKPEVFKRLDMRVGKIVNIENHPNAESLYKEEIDLGEGKTRQVVSGLVKFVPIEEMRGRLVVVLCNLKAGNIRNVRSEAMVICASNKEHTQVEPLDCPPGSVPGDKITVDEEDCPEVSGPDDVINLSDKTNVFAKLQADLLTNSAGIATFKGKALKTDKGTFSAKTLQDCHLG